MSAADSAHYKLVVILYSV